MQWTQSNRSSCQRCLVKKAVLKSFANFTGKQESLSFLQLCWKETSTKLFSCEYCKIFKNTSFEEHLQTTVSGCITGLWIGLCNISNSMHNIKTERLVLKHARFFFNLMSLFLTLLFSYQHSTSCKSHTIMLWHTI